MGRVYQINIKPESQDSCGLPKVPVDSVFVGTQGCKGDFNNFRTAKKGGTLDRAILIYPFEMIAELNHKNRLLGAIHGLKPVV